GSAGSDRIERIVKFHRPAGVRQRVRDAVRRRHRWIEWRRRRNRLRWRGRGSRRLGRRLVDLEVQVVEARKAWRRLRGGGLRIGTGGRGRSSADGERRIAGEFRHAEQVLGIQPPRRALVRLERRGSPYLVRRRTDGARGRTDGSGGRSPTGLSPGA